MRVSVRFVDGEHLEGDAEHVSLDRGGFKLSGPGGNTRSVWVGSGAIKYIVIRAAGGRRSKRETDPREKLQLSKVVLHFLDGEILRSYQDEVFSEEPGGFLVRLWDRERRQLVKALVSGSSLKGVFFVDEWDSRTEDETRFSTSPDQATSEWIDRTMAAAEAPAPEVATPEAGFVVVEEPALRGPMLVEEPVLLGETVPADAPVLPEEPLPADAPVLPEEPLPADALGLPENPVVAIMVGDSEERRPSFRSALVPRRMVAAAVPGPEELRYRVLRARISEVLGQAGPKEHEDDAQPEQET